MTALPPKAARLAAEPTHRPAVSAPCEKHQRAPAEPAPGRPGAQARSAYRRFVDIGTRWMDNDVYGHVNNVVYYSFFDTAVNGLLVEAGVLDIAHGEVIGLVVETQCRYFAPLAFPQRVQAGVRVAHLGRTSVRYEVGLFSQHSEQTAAHGHFVHVYVDRLSRRPVGLPAPLRTFLEQLA